MKVPIHRTTQRRELFVAALAAAATVNMPPPAFAKYGEFANMPSKTDFAVGNDANECLFAQPGTGNCMVYKSSQPPLWETADTGLALKKLLSAAVALNDIEGYIAAQKWTAISQALGASRDLREAVGFLTKASGNEAAGKQAKKVFTALDGIALAASKKDGPTAKIYFDKYAAAMPTLIEQFSS